MFRDPFDAVGLPPCLVSADETYQDHCSFWSREQHGHLGPCVGGAVSTHAGTKRCDREPHGGRHDCRLIRRTAGYGPVCPVVWEGEAARPTPTDGAGGRFAPWGHTPVHEPLGAHAQRCVGVVSPVEHVIGDFLGHIPGPPFAHPRPPAPTRPGRLSTRAAVRPRICKSSGALWFRSLDVSGLSTSRGAMNNSIIKLLQQIVQALRQRRRQVVASSKSFTCASDRFSHAPWE
jgi:hypothetical protein